ncbi:SGNH/GDSL hydrolase family protein [Verrucomicrobiaceae bacterium 227]
MFPHWLKFFIAACLLTVAAQATSTPSFAHFDQRAKAGEHLNVVFFGASLTWGSNATDPQLTSYRARVSQQLTTAYPKAHFTFRDAAIGGTGSQLGVFRLDRDVLRHDPDLVFLDFSANDDIYEDTPETLASYESLVRRIITEGQAPVVQMILPFGWNVQAADFEKMKRRTAHLGLSKTYHTTVGDAILLAVERVRGGETTIDKIWPSDQVHPGDDGYQLFADAAWTAFQDGVKRNVVCAAPEKMRYAETYLKNSRVRLSTLGQLPPGWQSGTPNLTSAYFDMLMSRWLDDEVIASNRVAAKSAEEQVTLVPQEVGRLKVKFRGTMVMLFGEGTMKSGKYRVSIDGSELAPGSSIPMEFNSAKISRPSNGNTHHVQIIAENLDASKDHLLEIEPLFSSDKEQELRLESICVAGGDAFVFPFDERSNTEEPVPPIEVAKPDYSPTN